MEEEGEEAMKRRWKRKRRRKVRRRRRTTTTKKLSRKIDREGNVTNEMHTSPRTFFSVESTSRVDFGFSQSFRGTDRLH